MKTSEQVDKIIPALLKVKAKLQAVVKDSNNPFYKSKYADLESHLLEVEPLLAENELLLLQPPTYDPITNTNVVESVIFDKSGQFVSSSLAIASGLDAQKTGASVTYYRRFTLGALLGIINADDDGNMASGKEKVTTKTTQSIPAVNSLPATGSSTTSNSAITLARPSFRRPPKTETTPTLSEQSSQDDI